MQSAECKVRSVQCAEDTLCSVQRAQCMVRSVHGAPCTVCIVHSVSCALCKVRSVHCVECLGVRSVQYLVSYTLRVLHILCPICCEKRHFQPIFSVRLVFIHMDITQQTLGPIGTRRAAFSLSPIYYRCCCLLPQRGPTPCNLIKTWYWGPVQSALHAPCTKHGMQCAIKYAMYGVQGV